VFVKPDVGVGGDGSRDAPYDTIARAVARARSGDVVALADTTQWAGKDRLVID